MKCQGLPNKNINYHDTYNLHDVDFISDNNNSAISFFLHDIYFLSNWYKKGNLHMGGEGLS